MSPFGTSLMWYNYLLYLLNHIHDQNSGKSQGILKWVREFRKFMESQGKVKELYICHCEPWKFELKDWVNEIHVSWYWIAGGRYILIILIIWLYLDWPWWRHQMETFSALLAICAGNSPVTGEFPAQRPVTLSFDVFFDLRLKKLLSKHSWGWWFEMPSRSLWRHCNDLYALQLCSGCWVDGTGVHVCREGRGGPNHRSPKLSSSVSFKQLWRPSDHRKP